MSSLSFLGMLLIGGGLIVGVIVVIVVIVAVCANRSSQQQVTYQPYIPQTAQPQTSEPQQTAQPQQTEPQPEAVFPEEQPEKTTLPEAIKNHRIRCGMTQEQVAEALEVSRQAVSKWETGGAEPSTSNLLALAKLFGISAAELLDGIE